MWKVRGSPPQRGTLNLEEVLCAWGQQERVIRPAPDLWPRLRPELHAVRERPERRLAVSLAAALGATYLVAPVFYATFSQQAARLTAWVGAGPAWLFSSWERWWQLLVYRLFG